MKKYIFILFATIILYSCGNKEKQEENINSAVMTIDGHVVMQMKVSEDGSISFDMNVPNELIESDEIPSNFNFKITN